MKAPAPRALIIAGAAGALCWAWYLMRMGPGRDPRALPPTPPGRLPLSKTGGPPATGETGKDAALRALDPAILARMEQWLEKRGRDAAGLVALYDVTGRIELLHEAAGNWPHDPLVSLAMVRHLRADPAKALAWIEQFLDAEPKNPEGYFLLHWALSAAGAHSAAFEALRKAASFDTPRDTHLPRRGFLVYEAALASGLDTGAAVRLATTAPLARGDFSLTTSTVVPACLKELNEAQASGSEARLFDAAGLSLGAVQQIISTPGLSVADELHVLALRMDTLKLLPEDAEIGNLAIPVTNWRFLTEIRRANVEKVGTSLPQSPALLNRVSDPTLVGYLNRSLSRSERDAFLWLQDQTPDPSVAETHPPSKEETQAPSTSTQRSP
jgi:hypothetical protein